MNVRAFQLYLRSLRAALSATDGHSPIPGDIDTVHAALEPFADLDFARFAAFLRQAEEYRATGVVSTSAETERAQAGLRSLSSLADRLSEGTAIDASHLNSEREKARQELEQALVVFLKPLAIDVTLKANPKGFESILLRLRMRPVAVQVRDALQGVTDKSSLNQPERQEKLKTLLDPLELEEMKAIAAELGVESTARAKKETLQSAVVEKLSGIKPAGAGTRRSSGAAAIDQALVQQQAVKLKGLLEKSLDPDALSQPEVDAAIAELKVRTEAELRAIVEETGLENMGKKKADILKKIGLKLTEARRAQESIQV